VVATLFICGLFGLSNGGPIMLASKGAANYTVVSPPYASPSEKFAADELAKYLRLISKAPFRISAKLIDHPIIAGSVELLQKILPRVTIPALKEEEFCIFIRDNNICLVGGSDRSTLYAVYDFLGSLGCDWVAPEFDFFEGKSQRIPVQPELQYIPVKETIQRPGLSYRKLYIEEGLSHNAGNLATLVDWMPKSRFNILVAPLNYEGQGRVKWDNWRENIIPEIKKRGIIIEVGGHGYQNFLNATMEDGQLFNKHPEWFGMDEAGRRTPDPHRVFCTSNASAVDYLHKNLLSYLQHHPEIGIFDFWPPDSEKWCTCKSCLALGNAADRHSLLVSQTALWLRKEISTVKLECIAYSNYVAPPPLKKLDKQVLVDFCPIRQSFEFQIYEDSSTNNANYRQNLLAWLKSFEGDISIYSYFRKYAWRSLPNIIPHYMQNDIRYYRDIGAKGISVYSEPGDWFTYGLNHYVLGKIAWDPDTNVDSLTDVYCASVYGEGSQVAALAYRSLEQIVRRGCSIPHTTLKTVGTYERFANTIDSCRRKVSEMASRKELDDITRRHLNRLGLMLAYAGENISLQHLKAMDAPEEKTSEIVNDIRQLFADNKGSGLFISRKEM
jgi:hypothetical protein